MAAPETSKKSIHTSPYAPGSLQDHFLISMPHMADQHFDHTVTYICDHSEYGAMGIVVNRPLDMDFQELMEHLKLDKDTVINNAPIYAGGPVQSDRGFILHLSDQSNWASSYPISDQLSLTTSMDILEAIANGDAPHQYLIALGYAGWGVGQLEQEMSDNTWLSCTANLDIIFDTPAEERLQAAASILGVNLDLLTSQSGHA